MILDKKTKVKRVVTIVLVLILIGCIAFLAWHWGQEQHAKEVQSELSGEVTPQIRVDDPKENPIDFESLKEQNPDIYAWIVVEGTDISYPILQNQDTTDLYDEYYLNHLVDHMSGYAGSIFTQKINRLDFRDGNTVIYGHNLKNGTMFTALHDYEDPEFMEEHRIIHIYTPDQVLEYEVFAAVPFSDKHLMIAYDFNQETEVASFVEDVMEREGVFAEDVSVSGKDRLITLSTCMNGVSNERYLVVAKLIEE